MKRILLLPILLFSFCFASNNHPEVIVGSTADKIVSGAEMVRLSTGSRIPSYIRLRPGKEIPEAMFEEWFSRALKTSANDALIPIGIENDQIGMVHKRYQQTFKGIPVEGSMVIAHIRDGKVVSLNGEFFLPLVVNTSPSSGPVAALSAAKKHLGARSYKWELPEEELFLQLEQKDASASFFPDPELVIVPEGGDYRGAAFRLAWKFDIYAHQPLGRWDVFVDAVTGKVIHKNDRLKHADTPGTAETAYSGTQGITSDSFGGGYRLRESGRGGGIETYDMNEGTAYGAAVDFEDTDNYWNNVNAQQDEVATDAHWGAEMTWDYYWYVHGRNSIDGSGFKLRSYIHYDAGYVNAFWDGSRMTYGDGNGSSVFPLTSIDVAGHEITHGLTDRTADLIYSNESGALNESFSDIFGTAIEAYGEVTGWDWNMGEDITSSGTGLRNMANPNSKGDPDTYLGTNWYSGTADNGGVHTNSGVQNFWFYLLTTGGSGTNDNSDPYAVTSIGMTDAGKIAFRNLVVYLGPNSNYSDARFFSIQAAVDLFGPCSPQVESTTNAWYAVGVGDEYSATVIADFTTNRTEGCGAPFTVRFSNYSFNAGTYTWDFGDGTTSTDRDPVHTFSSVGTYTVKLIADGGLCGVDTLTMTDLINIDEGLPCTIVLDEENYNDTLYACGGTMYDSGGPFENYHDLRNSIITIAPPGATSVTLNFSSFNFEEDYDYLYIYDGPSTADPLIGSYTGATLPGGGTVSSTGGAITIRQYSDPFVNESGFELTWECAAAGAPPFTKFQTEYISECSGTVVFEDLTTNEPISWLWDFGDGNTSTLQNPTHTYAASGTYTVTLIASNITGSDTMVRTDYVTIFRPAGPTSPPQSSCGASAFDLTATGSGGDFSWYDSPSGGTLLGTGSTYNTGTISTSDIYYVEEQYDAPSIYGGPADNSFGGGGYFDNEERNLFFDVAVACTLKSIKVYAGSAGTRIFEWRDGSGTVLANQTVSLPSGESRVTLNFALAPGTGYELGVNGGATVDLYRNNSNAAYPYEIGGMVTITGSDASVAGYYYFCYDWEIQGPDCITERTAVPVDVGTPFSLSLSTPDTVRICPGETATIVASGGASWSWSDGTSGSTLTSLTAGSFSVTATDGLCSESAGPVIVEMNPGVSASMTSGGISEFCEGDTVMLTASPSGAATYAWSDGSSGETLEVTSGGTFDVTITNASGCSDAASSITLIENLPPTALITPAGTTEYCAGESVTLSVSGGDSQVWSTTSTASSITVSSPGSYSAIVTDALTGCSDESAVAILVENPLPDVTLTPGDTVEFCEGDTATVNGPVGGTYAWSDGNSSPELATTVPGTYTLTFTDFLTGCTDTSDPVELVENPLPVLALSTTDTVTICDGEDTTITVSGADSYLWSSGSTASNETISTAGTYSIQGTSADGCVSNAILVMEVNPGPTAGFTWSAVSSDVDFSDISIGATTWEWSFGDGGSAFTSDPTHSYAASGTYPVSLVVTDGMCSDTTSDSVIVLITGLFQTMEGDLEVRVFPNPFRNELNIGLSVIEAGELKIDLTDMLGRQITTLYQGGVLPGDQVIQLNTPDQLAIGVYLLKVELNGRSEIRELIRQE